MLDLGSEGTAEGTREPAFLENHLAGLESNCDNPEGEEARGNAVVDVAVMGEGACGLRVWGCEGLRRERIVGRVWKPGIKSYAYSKRGRVAERVGGDTSMSKVMKNNHESIEQTRRISEVARQKKTNGTLSGARKSWPKRDKYTRDTPN